MDSLLTLTDEVISSTQGHSSEYFAAKLSNSGVAEKIAISILLTVIKSSKRNPDSGQPKKKFQKPQHPPPFRGPIKPSKIQKIKVHKIIEIRPLSKNKSSKLAVDQAKNSPTTPKFTKSLKLGRF